MCHVSVGHVQRAIEASGIVGISIEAFAYVARRMSLPRTLVVPHLLGRPVGPADQPERQRAVVAAALSLLASADGAVVAEWVPQP